MQPILTVTLNPALDLATDAPQVVPNRKLRCGPLRRDPGGGGINVSRTIRILGGTSTAFVVLGGPTGLAMEALLKKDGLDYKVFEAAEETRFSLAVTDASTGEQYRFSMPGPEIHEPDLLEADVIAEMRPGIVVLSGSLPPGCDAEFYARLVAAGREKGARVILDCAGTPFEKGLAGRPYLIKLDIHEAAALLGVPPDPGTALDLARDLVARDRAEVAIVTLLARGSVVATRDAAFAIAPTPVKVRSAVGAGDSHVGALALALARGADILTACRWGVAAATSTVETEGTALCIRSDVERYFEATARRITHL